SSSIIGRPMDVPMSFATRSDGTMFPICSFRAQRVKRILTEDYPNESDRTGILAVEDLQRRQSQKKRQSRSKALQDRSADPALVEVPLPIFAERMLGGAPDN